MFCGKQLQELLMTTTYTDSWHLLELGVLSRTIMIMHQVLIGITDR